MAARNQKSRPWFRPRARLLLAMDGADVSHQHHPLTFEVDGNSPCVSSHAGGPQLTGRGEIRLLVLKPCPAFCQQGVTRMEFWISRQVQRPALQRLVVVSGKLV